MAPPKWFKNKKNVGAPFAYHGSSGLRIAPSPMISNAVSPRPMCIYMNHMHYNASYLEIGSYRALNVYGHITQTFRCQSIFGDVVKVAKFEEP